jgi:AbrB family looped-hinge helix DNA binding protein
MEQFENGRMVFHMKVDSAGRVVIPVGVRERHRIAAGGEIVLEDSDEGIRLRTMDEVLRDVQMKCRKLAEPGVLQSEELIRERRAEAARELAEEAGRCA